MTLLQSARKRQTCECFRKIFYSIFTTNYGGKRTGTIEKRKELNFELVDDLQLKNTCTQKHPRHFSPYPVRSPYNSLSELLYGEHLYVIPLTIILSNMLLFVYYDDTLISTTILVSLHGVPQLNKTDSRHPLTYLLHGAESFLRS